MRCAAAASAAAAAAAAAARGWHARRGPGGHDVARRERPEPAALSARAAGAAAARGGARATADNWRGAQRSPPAAFTLADTDKYPFANANAFSDSIVIGYSEQYSDGNVIGHSEQHLDAIGHTKPDALTDSNSEQHA